MDSEPSFVTAPGANGRGPTGTRASVREALLGLGYAPREAEDAVRALPEDADGPEGDVGTLLKQALRSLDRR
jgi:Holliday junction DNA helicase RuvA